jgi:hypothetical protein
MAYLGAVLEDLYAKVTIAIEGIDPHEKSEVRFRRRSIEERMRTPFAEATGTPRLFDFDTDAMVALATFAGSSTVSYTIEIPLQIHYPRATGWHPAALDDHMAIHSLLASSPIAATGCHFCELRLGSFTSVPNGADGWDVVTSTLIASVEATL